MESLIKTEENKANKTRKALVLCSLAKFQLCHIPTLNPSGRYRDRRLRLKNVFIEEPSIFSRSHIQIRKQHRAWATGGSTVQTTGDGYSLKWICGPLERKGFSFCFYFHLLHSFSWFSTFTNIKYFSTSDVKDEAMVTCWNTPHWLNSVWKKKSVHL